MHVLYILFSLPLIKIYNFYSNIKQIQYYFVRYEWFTEPNLEEPFKKM